ncbi:MAG: carboxypeptidase-like regulatory domain-containing protein [Bryobacteraceae bacterium]
MQRLFFLSVLASFFSLTAFAQITAGIRGTVTDPTGAAVPSARVTATSTATGFAATATTIADGGYTLNLLPIGTYRLTVEASGFKLFERTNIALANNQVAGINVALEVGSVSEKVEVSSGAPLVNTQTTEVGQLIESKQIVDLPLNGRNPIQLATLVNGVSSTRVHTVLLGTDERDASALAVNGNRVTMTQYNLDGGEYAGMRMNAGLNFPNPDAIAEFRFITNNYSAEFGKNPGGVMNVVTKSGTNEIHGSAWEFNRNSNFAARSFFLPRVAPLNQNQFGFSGGGPVIKNKFFFFGTAQWLRVRQGRATTSFSPPTTAERGGDYSAFGRPILDPDNSNTPFPNARIPASRLDPVASKLIGTTPLPNSPDGRFLGAFPEPTNNRQYLLKGDYNINDRSRLTMSWFDDGTLSTSILDFGRNQYPIIGVTGPPAKRSNVAMRNAIANHTHSIRPNMINQFRFGWVRVQWDSTNEGRGPNLIDFGSNFPKQRFLDLPTMSVPGRISQFGGNDLVTLSNDFQFSDMLNHVVGRHNLKMGVEVKRTMLESLSSGNAHGALLPTGAITNNALSDFHLGRSGMFVSNFLGGDYRQHYQAFFFQDDFKVHRNFTLNVGLRYQISNPWYAIETVPLTEGGFVRPVSTLVLGAQSQVFVNAPKGLLYPGDPGIAKGGVNTDKNDFGPRAGLAWDIFGNGKTSIRAAWGLFFTTPQGQATTGVAYSAPFFINFNVPVTPSFVSPIPAALQSAFPVPTSRNMSFRPYMPLTLQGMDPNLKNAQVQQFNFTIQQELPGKIALQAGWVGNSTTGLEYFSHVNPAVYLPGNNPDGTPRSTIANTNNRRVLNLQNPPAAGAPFLYGPMTLGESKGNSNYHSLQVEARKSFTHGVTLLMSFTRAKAIDVASVLLSNGLATDVPQNPGDIRGSRGLAGFDQRNRFVTSLLYTTPSLSRAVGAASNPVLGRFLDHWNFGSIVTLAGGFPFNVTSGVDNSRTAFGADRPNLVGNPFLDTGRSRNDLIARYFNPSAFVLNNVGEFGNYGRNVLIGPGTANVDFTVNKEFPVSERLGKVQVRFEFFNLFNRPGLGNPGGNFSAPAQLGKIVSAGPGRIIQFGGKYQF